MLHDLIHRNTVSQPVDPLKFSLLAQGIFLDAQRDFRVSMNQKISMITEHMSIRRAVVMVTVNMVTYLLNCGEALF